MKVGIISDTHGLLRPEVFDRFQDVDQILHAGDIGSLDLLTELQAIAPVTAVWGNTDGFDLRGLIPEVAQLRLGDVEVVVLHGHQFGSPDPVRVVAAHPQAGLVVFGHSHQAVIERVGGTLALNPGSAGPRRFRQPVTLAVATLGDGQVEAEVLSLEEADR